MKKRPKTGTRIKRFIIFLLVVAAFTAVFYFGYYQFQLPVDNYAVIFTKLNGWDPEIVSPGGFRIEWEGLIPLNLRMERFVIKPVKKRISVSGELPSADTYSLYLEGSPAFNYSYSFEISYTVSPDSLAALAADDFWRADNFNSMISDIETELSAEAAGFIRQKADDDSYMKRIAYNYQLMEGDLMDFMASKYDFIEFIGFTPVEAVFPDMALYIEGKNQYFEIEKYNKDIQKTAMEETEKRLVEESAKLDLLRKYGEIFTDYPNLIDYYAIYQEDGAELIPSINLPDLDDQPITSP